MNVVLLAAGLGTRLSPLTDILPKCMMPIHDKPLLLYWLKILDNEYIDEIIVNTHYLSDVVTKFLSNSIFDKYKITIDYEPSLLMTGGTVLKHKSMYKNDGLLVAHADNLTSFDIKDFIHAHINKPSSCVMTMMTFVTDEPENCGVVKINNDGIVTSFYEKVSNPPTKLANGAVYIIDSEVMDFMNSLNKDIIDFSTEVLPYFIGRIFTYENIDIHIDIGTCKRYKKSLESYKYSVPEDYVDWDFLTGKKNFLKYFQNKTIDTC